MLVQFETSPNKFEKVEVSEGTAVIINARKESTNTLFLVEKKAPSGVPVYFTILDDQGHFWSHDEVKDRIGTTVNLFSYDFHAIA